MDGTVTTIQLKSGTMDEAIRVYQDSVVSVLKQQKGLMHAYMTTDRSRDKVVIFAVWETDAQARAFESSGEWQRQVAKIAPLLVGQPTREVYEISVET